MLRALAEEGHSLASSSAGREVEEIAAKKRKRHKKTGIQFLSSISFVPFASFCGNSSLKS
jgi:hypothetical protein